MKKLFFVLAALMTVPALYAAEDTPIQNVCDSLSLGATPVIELVPAYIDESNWYGNPKTWAKDSSNANRHETYETVKVSISSNKSMQLPVSIPASCRELSGQEVKYAKWNTHQEWEPYTEDDVETRIYTMRELSMNGHDETNTYNILAFVPGQIPQDYSFQSHQLLFSATFEFAFEYWFASASFEHKFRNADDSESTVRTSIKYVTSGGNDSLRVVSTVLEGLKIPDTTKSIHIQTLKVVLVDSRKLPQPQSSSSVVVSSSSEEKSSSNNTPVSSSSVEQSSSSATPASSADEESSSSAKPETSSSTGPVLSSSSNVPESSSAQESSSSDKPATSSSGEQEASSSSDKQETSSSSAEPESSSSEKTTRLVTAPNLDGSARMVQVRTLDGSIVKNSGNLAPGVYYVKYSNGKWSKMAVLPR
ncbi:MAG: hypothetical protein J5791_11230 [Fibrobacter sp.]|nr:hypothetical protein [Fibrobacter sp.]